MMLANLFSSDDKKAVYPISNMTTVSHKEALRDYIAKPLVEQNCSVLAFRVVWRGQLVELEQVWKNIIPYREQCDTILNKTDNIQFYISAITGLFNRRNQASGETVRSPVYPAIAYWVASNSDNFDAYQVLRNVEMSMRGIATVRPLGNAVPMKTENDFSSSLCTVLKDHNGGYINKRMGECHTAMNAEGKVPLQSRIVLSAHMESKPLQTIVYNAVESLNDAKLFIYCKTYQSSTEKQKEAT